MASNIYPPPLGDLFRKEREEQFGYRSHVFWLTGLSGSGKTTLAIGAEKWLRKRGICAVVLDGDDVRQGLCKDLGFSIEERSENVRRVAEIARILCQQGFVVICSLVSPGENMRLQASNIVGGSDFSLIYVEAPIEICTSRDPKGLYSKAYQGGIANFTGIGQDYEIPKESDLILNTQSLSITENLEKFTTFVAMKIDR